MLFDFIFLKYVLYIGVVIFSLLIVFMSNRGFFGIKTQKFLSVNTTGELLVSLIMVVGILMFIINLFLVLTNYLISIGHIDIDCLSVIDKGSNAQDPVRYWPSGTAQTWGVIGTAAALYRATPGSNRVKAAAALGSLSITIPLNVYIHAVENPNGFNRLMYSWIHYKNHGVWPADIPTRVGDQIIETALVKNAETNMESIQNSSTFLPINSNELLSYISPETILNNLLGLFRPVGVEGFLDDLIGQQLLIHLLLISVVIGLIILFTLYFLIQTMYNNREFIIKRFNNRFIKLYIKYQIILTNISLFVLPVLIFVGLLELFFGLYFLVTHPIPYELLPIDLHTYLKIKKS